MIKCHYCPEPATTRDHIVPRSKGGRNAAWNIVPACVSCNSAKAAKDPTCSCEICREAVRRHLGVERPSSGEWILPEFRRWYRDFTPRDRRIQR